MPLARADEIPVRGQLQPLLRCPLLPAHRLPDILEGNAEHGGHALDRDPSFWAQLALDLMPSSA